MYCSRCGNQYEASPNFCRICGQAIGGMARLAGMARFASLRGLARPLFVGLGLVIAFDVVLLALNIERISIGNRIIAGDSYPETEANLSSALYTAVDYLYIIPFIVASILFIVWIHHASSNLEPLGSRLQSYSPGWAAGWFFIPFANLVMPYLVTREVWMGSDPDSPDGDSWRRAAVPAMLPAWWTLMVINMLLCVPAVITLLGGSATAHLYEAWIALVGNVVEIGAAALFIVLVRRVTARQEEKASRMAAPAPMPAN